MNTISYEALKVGDWIRFYTNSLRGPGAITRLAQIAGFKYCRANKRLGIQRRRIGLTARNAVDAFDDVDEIIADEASAVNPPITKGISFL